MMSAFRAMLLSPGGGILLHGTALLLLAWAAQGALRGRHPRWRLILWRSVLVLCCLLPLELLFPPAGFRIALPAGIAVEAEAAVPAGSKAVPLALPADSARAGTIAAPTGTVPRAVATRSWTGVLRLLWILGAVALALRLLRLQIKLLRMRRNAAPPDAGLVDLAERVQSRLGVRQRVEIRISDEVSSPFVCGLWRPVMILPRQLLRTMEAGETSALLNHELAHMRSHDLAWCVGWRWMQSAAWFHPLVWMIPGAHNLACEEEADRLASSQWPDRGPYMRALAHLAWQVYALSSLETALTLNGTSQIAKRIELLRRDGFGPWRRRDSVAGIGLAAGLALVTSGWGFSVARAAGNGPAGPTPASNVEMKRYVSSDWNFAIDIPKNWNAFPPVSSNSPFEVIRFESVEDGIHLLIVFRQPLDPKKTLADWARGIQTVLAKSGFEHFSTGHTTIGSKPAVMLDFDKPRGDGTWSCRQYLISEGTYGYDLGFGTTDRARMFDLYDRMAKSFQADVAGERP